MLRFESKNNGQSKCMMFDLDGCMIVPANGKDARFAELIPSNYVFLYGVEDMIRDLISQEIKVVVITNQSNITDAKRDMIISIWNHFDQNIEIFCITNHSDYRKPSPRLINELKTKYEVVGYCGDAIGEHPFEPYKWSNVDLQFAINGDVNFYAPNQVFGSNFETVFPDEQLIIMIGNPGSGKTTISKRLEQSGFIRYSKDEVNIKTKRVQREILENLSMGRRVVIDATNGKEANRRELLDLFQGYSYHFLWCCRDGRCFNKLRPTPIPNIAYGVYTKNFERPTSNFTIVS